MTDHPATLILEDDQDRIDRFSAVLRSLFPADEIFIWRSAKTMIQEVDPHWAKVVCALLEGTP